jgi:hypothetical protein
MADVTAMFRSHGVHRTMKARKAGGTANDEVGATALITALIHAMRYAPTPNIPMELLLQIRINLDDAPFFAVAGAAMVAMAEMMKRDSVDVSTWNIGPDRVDLIMAATYWHPPIIAEQGDVIPMSSQDTSPRPVRPEAPAPTPSGAPPTVDPAPAPEPDAPPPALEPEIVAPASPDDLGKAVPASNDPGDPTLAEATAAFGLHAAAFMSGMITWMCIEMGVPPDDVPRLVRQFLTIWVRSGKSVDGFTTALIEHRQDAKGPEHMLGNVRVCVGRNPLGKDATFGTWHP